jgi:hypothetical protein
MEECRLFLTLYGYKTISTELHTALAIHDVQEVSVLSENNDDDDVSSMAFDPLDKLTGSEVHLSRTHHKSVLITGC